MWQGAPPFTSIACARPEPRLRRGDPRGGAVSFTRAAGLATEDSGRHAADRSVRSGSWCGCWDSLPWWRLLAALGLYGVISYSVSRHAGTRIRAALGASREAVMRLVVGQGVRLALTVGGIGLAASLAAGRWMKSQLFEVSAFDPLTFAAMALLLVGAGWQPATFPRAGPCELPLGGVKV